MASMHAMQWNTSAGLTNSSIDHDNNNVNRDDTLPTTRSAISTDVSHLYTPFSETLAKNASTTPWRHAQHGSMMIMQANDSDDQLARTVAQHATRIARYQKQEQECRDTLATLETRIHQLEQRRWQMEKSQLATSQQTEQAQKDALARRKAALQAEEAAMTALHEQKRAELSASLHTLDEQMRRMEDRQQWVARKLAEQDAVVERAEDLARTAQASAVQLQHEAEATTTRPLRLLACELQQEVASLEADTDHRLGRLRATTDEANAELQRAQVQLTQAHAELNQVRSQCERERHAYESLHAQEQGIAAAVQVRQSELQRVTARLDATSAELATREQRMAVRCEALASEEAQRTRHIEELGLEQGRRAAAIDSLRAEEGRVEAVVAEQSERATRLSDCAAGEAEVTQREDALVARRTKLAAAEEDVLQQEVHLCAHVAHLDEQARHAATLAAAAQADLIRGVHSDFGCAPPPTVASCEADLVRLTERVCTHTTCLSELTQACLQAKVDTFIDASDAVLTIRRSSMRSESHAPPHSTSTVLHV